MKFRKILSLVLILCLLQFGTVLATETTEPGREPGYCGDNITWSFSGGTLTISGSGRMDDFPDGPPWALHRKEVTRVVLTGGVTYVGAYAFSNFDKLTSVDFGGSLEEVGQRAFYSCDGLTSVSFPGTFICYGPESFMSCRNLKQFHHSGVCPHFRLNCLWDTYGTIYYPAGRPWPLKDIIELESAFHGRIEFRASDGSDPYDPNNPPPGYEPTTEPTEPPAPPTQPPVQPTQPKPTQPKPTNPPVQPTNPPVQPTNPPTVPPTTQAPEPSEEATEEMTEPTTEPTTAPTEETTAPTEQTTVPTEESSAPTEEVTSPTQPSKPEEQEPDYGPVPWGLLIIFLAVLAAIIIRAISANNKKKRMRKKRQARQQGKIVKFGRRRGGNYAK